MGIRISDVSLNQWNEFIQDHLESQGQLGTHKFIYINDQKQIAHFEDISRNKTGFSKISLLEMIKFTKDKINKFNDSKDLKTANELLQKLIEHHILEMGGEKTEEISHLFASNFELTPIQASLSASEVEARLDKELNNLTNVKISRDGTTKVYFLSIPEKHNGLILKLVPETDSTHKEFKHIVADRYFQKLGYVTPKYSAIPLDSDLGKKAFNAIKQRYSNVTQHNCSDITVMEFVEGTSFSQLSLSDQIDAFSNPKILLDLGEMIFYDCVRCCCIT